MSFDLQLKPGDCVVIMDRTNMRKYHGIVKKLTATQITVTAPEHFDIDRRFNRSTGKEIGGGYWPDRILEIGSEENKAATVKEIESAKTRRAESERREKLLDSVRALFPGQKVDMDYSTETFSISGFTREECVKIAVILPVKK